MNFVFLSSHWPIGLIIVFVVISIANIALVLVEGHSIRINKIILPNYFNVEFQEWQ